MTTTLAPSPSFGTPASPSVSSATFHTVQRRLAALIPDAETVAQGGALELSGLFAQEKPRLDPPELLEDKTFRARRVEGEATVRFSAFLDGTQSSRVAQYVGGVPIVHATVAAVIRTRHERRMATWNTPLVRRRLYAPLSLLTSAVCDALGASGADLFDTTAERTLESIHPFAVQEAAFQAVQRDRAALERELGEAWCSQSDTLLFIDGGISDSALVATSPTVVGVVKSHRQLYVHGDDLGVILRLKAGERSSVCRVAPRGRSPVASWYLRLRAATGHDPLWGLVRVEIAAPAARTSTKRLAERADEVSRWILAEALPLSVPDARWDKMVYPIRDCEEFLRSIQ
ncbi:MAG TPA: hypothetical protein VFT29_20620 [Gemmatimonadaceae bacterium]|nr:hypothetical protein [Gemmatimonadaceae bacterium]